MAAAASLGAKFQYNTGAGLTDVANVTSISMPGGVVTEIETTNLGTTGGYKTFIPGLIDPQEVTVEAQFDTTVYETLEDELGDNTVTFGVVDSGTGTTATFGGYIKSIDLNFPGYDELQTMTITVRISGAITIT